MKKYIYFESSIRRFILLSVSALMFYFPSMVIGQQQIVLPTDGSSSAVNSPQGGLRYLRQLYLITPAEMAASGLQSGIDLNSIGFTFAAPQDITTEADFEVYLQNTLDTESRIDTDWTQDTVSTNSLALTNITAGDYEWQVRAVCGSNSPFTDLAEFSNGDLSGCNRPLNLNATSITESTATLNWFASVSPDFVEYIVEFKVFDSPTWIVDTTTSQSIGLTGLTPSKTYQWNVRTVCTNGESEVSAGVFGTLNINNCNSPSGLNVSSTTNTTANLEWTATAGANRYDIRFRRVGTTFWFSSISLSESTTLNFGLEAGTTYEWAVRTVCDAGQGAYIAGDNFNTGTPAVCYAPTDLFTNNISDTTATLNWTESIGATSYIIRYRLKNAISWTNAILPMTKVHDDTIVVPSEIGSFAIPFSMGDPFTYDGNGLYVAFQFRNDSTQVSSLNNALATNNFDSENQIILCLDGPNSSANSGLTDFLTYTNLRPETSFGSSTFIDSVSVDVVYALGSYPLDYSSGAEVSAIITNYADEERTYMVHLTVNEEESNTQRHTESQSLTIAADTSVIVTFSGWVPAQEETDILTVSVAAAPTENVLGNNSAVYSQRVTSSTTGFDDGSLQINSTGFGVGSGLILIKQRISGCGKISAANVFLDNSAVGDSVYAVILDEAGTILDTSFGFEPGNKEAGAYHTFYFPNTPDITDGVFYVGLAQVADAVNPYYPVGIQFETDMIRDTAYFRSDLDGTSLVDHPLPGRLMISAEIIPCGEVPIIVGDFSLCPGETNQLNVASATVRYANQVRDYSSEAFLVDYSTSKALGAPDAYPTYGINQNAWASATPDGQREFLELSFANPAPINFVEIYEVSGAGAVDTVYVKNPGTGLFEMVYTGTATVLDSVAVINRISFPLTAFNVSEVRIALASDDIPGFNSIDAVGIGELTTPGIFSSYLWSPNGETTNGISVMSAGEYSVVVTDASSNQFSASAVVNSPQQIIPFITLGVGDTSVFCAGGNAVLKSDQNTGNMWSTGDTTSSITVTTSGLYTVSFDDGLGCGVVTSDPFQITVNPLPTPTISGTLGYCPGGSTTLDAGPGFSSYFWSTGDTTQTISVNTNSVVNVVVTYANGCAGTSPSVFVVPFSNPSPTITGNLVVCLGESTTLDAGAGYSTYLWSTGDTTRTISVSTAGTFSVVVTNSNGCQGSDDVTTTVNIPPSPVIGGSTSFCGGSSTTLDAGPGYNTYLWSTGAISQTIVVNLAQTYSVTVTDFAGCSGSAITTTTTEGVIPEAPGPISGQSSGLCNASNVIYTIDPVANATFYVWTVPTGVSIVSGQGTTILVVDFGPGFTSGNIVVAASNACGQSPSIDPTIISVSGIPDAPGSITGPGAGVCNQTNVQFSVGAVAGATAYIWSVPTGSVITSGQSTPTINVTLGGTSGEVCVRVLSDCGISSPTCSFISLPEFTVDAGECNFVFPGVSPLDCIELTATVTGGTSPFTFDWMTLLGVHVGNTQTINVCPTESTSYIVTVVDANGCTITDKVEVQAVTATCKGNKVLVCHIASGKTLCLSPGAAQNHLSHGDYLGSCDDELPCNNRPSNFSTLLNGQVLETLPFSFEETEGENAFLLYPNPAGTMVTIALQAELNEDFTINLVDPLQRVIKSVRTNHKHQSRWDMDLQGVQPGLYFMQVQIGDQIIVKPLLVSRNE